MRHSASQLDDTSPLGGYMRDGMLAVGAAISRNPLMVGGGTAFLVTLFVVSANALWNQPQPHTSTFFITREMPRHAAPTLDETEDLEENELPGSGAAAPAVRKTDPVVEKVQNLLGDLDLYTGSVDGIVGPQTRKAVEDYQRLAGLDVSGEINERLLDELTTKSAAPVTPAARPAPEAASVPQATVVKIQAGLKAFGHDGIEIDGVIGLKTRSAIREFQTLFGLPVTGEPDETLFAKMREIGLTD